MRNFTKPLNTSVGTNPPERKSLPVDQIIVDARRRPVNDAKVSEMMESIDLLGLLQPIVVTRRTNEDGGEEYRLIGGGHRLEVYKRRGLPTIPCTVLEFDQALRVELAGIDENFIRNDPGPAEHARLTGRRREIIRKLGGTVLQDETPSKQGQRRAGQETGPDAGSLQDQANQTGESKAKIHRSQKRFETIGPEFLESIVGTSLDTGVELDALAELPEQIRGELVTRAAAGDEVSAKKELRKLQHKPPVLDVEHALRNFERWQRKYKALWAEKGWSEKIDSIGYALRDIVEGIDDRDDPEDAGWFYRWRKARKDD
jgi:hypothetical protein